MRLTALSSALHGFLSALTIADAMAIGTIIGVGGFTLWILIKHARKAIKQSKKAKTATEQLIQTIDQGNPNVTPTMKEFHDTIYNEDNLFSGYDYEHLDDENRATRRRNRGYGSGNVVDGIVTECNLNLNSRNAGSSEHRYTKKSINRDLPYLAGIGSRRRRQHPTGQLPQEDGYLSKMFSRSFLSDIARMGYADRALGIA